MTTATPSRSRLALAADLPLAEGLALYEKVAPHVGYAKVGLSLFVEHGPAAVAAFQKLGVKHSRLMLPWDWYRDEYTIVSTDQWMAQAKAAAGNRNVLVQGAYTAQRALEARALDELQIHQVPVLLGRGRRLFDVLPSEIELEIIRVIDTPEATHIRYRVRR